MKEKHKEGYEIKTVESKGKAFESQDPFQLDLERSRTIKSDLAKLIKPLIQEESDKFPKGIPSAGSFVERLIHDLASEKANGGNGPSPTKQEVDCLNRWLQLAVNSFQGQWTI
ncbi:hypothetical protein VNO80_33110 [Phaseolus coccineus]|uniref:Uncharacterized protein n=1 Tax=Phaseolus coccineus TaxID=3886 RepID=A0AAN9KYN7_PHACN